MAQVLSNFLIGIGMDFDSKGAKEASSAIEGIKSTALQAGAVIAGAFGIKKLTADFAGANDQLGKFSQTFGVIPNDVAAMGRALEHEGGTLASFMSQLESIEGLRAGLLTGDAEFISRAGIAGIDASVITSAESATEAYSALADQFQRMTTQQRINAAEALGLDEASIRLLSKGRAELDKAVDIEKSLRPLTAEMTKTSAEFNDLWQDMWTRVGSVSDRASMQILPAVNDIISGMSNWFDANREIINQGVDKTFGFIADNLFAVSTASALLAGSGALKFFAGLAKSIPVIGNSLPALISGMGKFAGIAGATVAAGSAGYALGSVISENLSDETNTDVGRVIAKTLAFFGSDEAQRALDLEVMAGGFTPAGTTILPSEASRVNESYFPSHLSKPEDKFKKYSGQPAAQRTLQPIVINLDGKPFRDMIINVSDEQAGAVLDDIKSPFKG